MFAFEIGQTVILKIGITEAEQYCATGNACFPKVLLVIERLSQECPGGFQLQYQVSDGAKVYQLNEIELARPEAFDAAKWHGIATDVVIEAERRKREQMDAM